MILLLRLITAGLAAYFIYMVYQWWNDNHSPYVTCPQCEGAGVWHVVGTDEEDKCILCRGEGKIEREL